MIRVIGNLVFFGLFILGIVDVMLLCEKVFMFNIVFRWVFGLKDFVVKDWWDLDILVERLLSKVIKLFIIISGVNRLYEFILDFSFFLIVLNICWYY